MVPGVTRVAVLHEQNFAPGDIELKQLEAASLLNLKIHATGVAPPQPSPVWQPEKVELVINRQTAKALNLTLTLSLVGFAEKIIE